MGRIIFYEDRNFQGRSYGTSSACPELTSNLSRCNSFRVESGCFMVYEKPNFRGPQKIVRRGEYPDHHTLMGMSKCDCIRSCRTIPMHRGQFRIRLYERKNFTGPMHELMDDCDSTQERFHLTDYESCNVMEGHWLLYEDPHFRGRELYMRPGEYRTIREMDTRLMDTRLMDTRLMDTRFGSIRRIMEFC